jgi:endoglucanase
LDYLKGKGMNLIRFPFRWERIQRELNGELYAEEIQLMKNLINGANERNMKIFIDMHNFGRRGRSEYDLDLIDGNNSPVTRHHLADAWKKLALEFKDLNLWGYDLMNEPHDMANSNSWFIIAQEVIDSIRTVDMNTPIIICGDRWSSAYHWPGSSDNLKNLNDPADKLIYQAHLYFDANESGTYNGTYASENATPQTGVNRATPFVNWLKANNKKGFLGEYGFPVYSDGSKQTDEEKWALVLDNMLKYLQENAVTGTYWSTGTRWGRNKLSADPKDSPDGKSDRPQMLVLEKYKMTNAITTP